MLKRCNDCPKTFGNFSCSGDCEWRMQRVRENIEFQCAQKRKLSYYYYHADVIILIHDIQAKDVTLYFVSNNLLLEILL